VFSGLSGGSLAVRALLGAAALALLAHAALALLGLGDEMLDGDLSNGIFYALLLLAATACVTRAGLDEGEREVWIAAGAAMSAWAAGSIHYAGTGSLERLTSTWVGDPVLLGFFAAAALALGLLVRNQVQPFQPTILLDGVIVTLAAAAVAATLLEGGFDRLSLEAEPATIKLLYPLGALMLFSLSVWVTALTGWRSDRRWTFLVVGLGLFALASTAFVFLGARGGYAQGDLFDTVWLGGALAIAIAAWQPRAEPLRVRLAHSRRISAVSAAALVALGLLVASHFAPLETLTVIFAAAALIAMVGRAAVSFGENVRMFAHARMEAQTDSLTGLGNRRKLMTDLGRELELASVESPRVLVMFDLDGFKRYNDTYGHPAGDALLTRLGASLGRAIRPYGAAYRIGGDEFCVLVVTGASSAKMIIALSAAALSERGEGFTIRSSHGAVILPHEARDATLALRIADQRMYAHKDDRRESATRQTRDILLQLLQEREPELGNHLKGVAKLALGVATRLKLGPEELDEVVRAAELHDVGKMAIPDEILHKPGPLSDEEWAFVRQHTIIGERILSAAPALLPVAKLVRASHEHFDGSGYPDGLARDAIPLGARIVSVCDAFDAMTSSRPYRPAISSVDEALEELRACAGSQFDPEVVEAFCAQVAALGPRIADRVGAPVAAPIAPRLRP
jgi:two-component system cell cycle response regulator